MARQTSKGFYVWDLTTDAFSHAQLAANWDLADSLFDQSINPAKQVEISATVPASGNFAGRVVMLNAATGGFAAWTMIRYDGANWRPIGPFEILPSVPVSGNFAGRVIILSAANGGFDAWSMIRYDGTSWGVVGGFGNINTGGVSGLQIAGDVYFSNSARGPVLKDRTTGENWRLFIDNGRLLHELVT